MELPIVVVHGGVKLSVSLPPGATGRVLKLQLEPLVQGFAREFTLVAGGKTLGDGARVDSVVKAGGRVLLLAPLRVRPACEPATQPVVPTPTGEAAGHAWDAPISTPAMLAATTQPTAAPSTGAVLPLERVAAWRRTGQAVLRESGLSEVPAAVWSLGDAARTLDLEGNAGLRRLPPAEVGRLTSLTRLSLCGCGVDSGVWEEAASAGGDWLAAVSQGLHVLLLDRSPALRSLPPSLGRLVSLTHLSLANSPRLTGLPDAVGALVALRRLDASHCLLTGLPDALGGCGALEELLVDGNAGLRALPAGLGACAHLALLSAQRCGVVAAGVPSELLRAPALHTLLLASNPLTLDELRKISGFVEFDARRLAKAGRAIDGGLDASASFAGCADAELSRRS